METELKIITAELSDLVDLKTNFFAGDQEEEHSILN